jgi:hypothetical protein
MPYLATQTTCPITPRQEQVLKTRMGEAISLLPGKSEEYLMLSYEGGAHLWFAGDNAPAAMIRVDVYGALEHRACETLTARLCEILSDVLGIPGSRTYVRYSEIREWGWNGAQF